MIIELETFSKFLSEEEFENGRRWARDYLAKTAPDLLTDILQYEDDCSQLTTEIISKITPVHRVIAFADLYFDARIQIETSYNYISAIEKLERARPLLDCMAQEACPKLMQVLGHICDFQQNLCAIDRAVYIDAPSRLTEPCQRLLQAVENAEAAAIDMYNPWQSIFESYLKPILASNAAYAECFLVLGSAHKNKWELIKTPEKINNISEKINKQVDILNAQGAAIQASEVLPSLKTLQRFASTNKNAEELNVKSAETRISYFAVMAPSLMDAFACAIDADLFGGGQPAINLGNIKYSAIDRESLPDIWNSLIGDLSPYEYRWRLSDISIPYKDKGQTAYADLIYSRLGFWRLDIVVKNQNISPAAFKQMGILATPYSLDNDISVQAQTGVTQKYAFLSEFCEDVFSALDKSLNNLSEKEDIETLNEKGLIWSTEKNWFTLEVLETLTKKSTPSEGLISGQAVLNHPGFKEMSLPSREVRAALSSWVMREPLAKSLNLAPLRYNDQEVIFASRNTAFCALLEQPEWVVHQAKDTLTLCAALAHMVALTTETIMRHESATHKTLKKMSGKALDSEIESLEALEGYIIRLLSIIEGGQLIAYADQSDFIEAVLETLELGKSREHLHNMLNFAKSRRLSQIKEVDTRHRKWIKRAITLGTAFLTIGAVGEVFDVIDAMGMTFLSLTPVIKLSLLIFSFLCVLIIGQIAANKTD